jgi:hypothetical protein
VIVENAGVDYYIPGEWVKKGAEQVVRFNRYFDVIVYDKTKEDEDLPGRTALYRPVWPRFITIWWKKMPEGDKKRALGKWQDIGHGHMVVGSHGDRSDQPGPDGTR